MINRLLVPTTIALALAATGAYAATPPGGEVSGGKPEVKWGGELFNSGPVYNAWEVDPSAPCPSDDQCDPFTLTVGSAGNLTLSIADSAAPSNGTAAAGFRVQKPDGSYVFSGGDSTATTPYSFTLEGVQPGRYVLHAADAVFGCCVPHGYSASAHLKAAGGGPTLPATPPTPPPPSDPGPPTTAPQPPAPAPESTAPRDFTLTARAPRVSARRAKRSFRVAVTTSRAIEKLTVSLKKGKRTVGSGTLAPFSGKGSVRLTSKRRLKAGRYQLVVVGQDGGVSVARTLRLRIRR